MSTLLYMISLMLKCVNPVTYSGVTHLSFTANQTEPIEVPCCLTSREMMHGKEHPKGILRLPLFTIS